MPIRGISSVGNGVAAVPVPAGTRRGDIMLFWSISDIAGSSNGGNVPTGFTSIKPALIGTTIDGANLRLNYRIATSAEPATYTQPSPSATSSGMVVLWGVRLAGFQSSARTINVGRASPWNLPGTGVMLRETSDVLWFGVSDIEQSQSGVAYTAPPGFAKVQTVTIGFFQLLVAMKQNVRPGPTGTLVGIGTSAGRTAGSIVRVVAFPSRRVARAGLSALSFYRSASISITARTLSGYMPVSNPRLPIIR